MAAATDDDYLAVAAACCTTSRFGTFFIPGVGEKEHIHRARTEYGMHFVRIGNDPEKIDRIIPYVEYARGLGLEVMANYMKTYAISPAAMARSAKALVAAGAETVYVVDSAGGMLPDEVGDYVRALAQEVGCRVGFHGHNNLELAVANAVAAWRNGCALIDCSIGGLGRSSGNTRTELLMPVLKAMGVELPYDYLEVLRVWQQLIRPVMQRRRVTAEDVVGGFARVHSGLMGPFREAAARHAVDETALLYASGTARLNGRADATPAQLAAELAAAPVTPVPADPASRCSPTAGPGRPAHNPEHVPPGRGGTSGRERARPQGTAPGRPPGPGPADGRRRGQPGRRDGYHDDHFILLRATFGSVPTFRSFLDRFRGSVNVLAFHGLTGPVRDELRTTEADWRQAETVVWVNPGAARIHFLRGVLQDLVRPNGRPERVPIRADARPGGPAPGRLAALRTVAFAARPATRSPGPACGWSRPASRTGTPAARTRPWPTSGSTSASCSPPLATRSWPSCSTRWLPAGSSWTARANTRRTSAPSAGDPNRCCRSLSARRSTGELLNLLAAGPEGRAERDAPAPGGSHAVRLSAA